MKRLIKDIVFKISGSDEKYTLEERLVNIVLFFACISTFFIIINEIICYSNKYISYFFSSVFFIISLILYYLEKKKRFFKTVTFILAIISYFALVYTWLFFGGIIGLIQLYSITFLVVFSLILKGNKKYIYISCLILLLIVLYLMEKNYPYLITVYKNKDLQAIDVLIRIIINILTLCLIITIVIQKYLYQHKKIKDLNISLEKMNKTKIKLLSIIAHDLKNPISGITCIMKLLINNKELFEKNERKKIDLMIHSTAKNAYHLLENLLIWTRTEKEEIKLNLKKFEINKVISYNLELLKILAEQKNISLLFKPETKIFIYADKFMIDTVIRNFIQNAIKFSFKNSVIEIALINTTNEVQFYVKDTGVGIPKETLSSIFELDSDISRNGTNFEKGSGIGLQLCYQFISKNKGKIWVESVEGKGSTFYFSLPVQKKI